MPTKASNGEKNLTFGVRAVMTDGVKTPGILAKKFV